MPAVYLDSCIFVLAFEGGGHVLSPAQRLLRGLRDRPGISTTSELTIAELLAPTKREQVMSVAARRRLYLTLFDESFIELAPVTRQILLATVDLREEHPHKIADAIHVATAKTVGAKFFVSFDRDAKRMPSNLVWTTPTEQEVTRLFEELDA